VAGWGEIYADETIDDDLVLGLRWEETNTKLTERVLISNQSEMEILRRRWRRGHAGGR
jgi:hypothetical protein